MRVIIKSGEYQSKALTRRQLNVLSEFESSVGRADVIFFLLKKQYCKHLGYGTLARTMGLCTKDIAISKALQFMSLYRLAVYQERLEVSSIGV